MCGVFAGSRRNAGQLGFVQAMVLAGSLAARPAAARSGKDHELIVVPVVGGSSDVGFGGGYVASYAQMANDREPFLYRLENAGSVTFKPAGDHLEVPYTDDYLLLELPHVIPKRFRIDTRISFTREENLKYYGLGNAARAPAGTSPTLPRYEYGRTHPTLRVDARYRVVPTVRLEWGLSYTQNWLRVPQDGLLAEDMRNGPAYVRRLLHTDEPHAVVQASYGVSYDSRDDQISTHRGQFHGVRLTLAPGGTGMFPYEYGNANLTLRGYVPLASKVFLATRVVADALFGKVPFYELARFDDTYAIGGGNGVRGVPAQAYYGKIKLLGNLELRSELVRFHAFSKGNVLGITGFFDTGRVWLDYRPAPTLDGTGLGLKYGVGGGVRWASGESFVLRGDIAWSPDARPVGLYLAAGQLF